MKWGEPMADGSIRIETKLDNSVLKQQIRELEKELKNIQKEQDKANAQADSVRSKYDAERAFDAQFPEEFSHREDIDKRAAKELDPIIAKQDELNAKKQEYLSLIEQTKSKLQQQSDVAKASKEMKSASVTAAAKVETNMKKATEETNRFGNAIKGAIKKIGKMSLAVFGIRGAYRAVRMALTEYLATNQQLAGQIDTLKSLFAQVLGPAIEWVVNLLIKGVAAINSFVYALTGINFVAKANAAALKKQAEASQQTAGFDEQTKLSGNGSESGVGTLPDGTSMDLSFLDPLMESLRKFKEDITPLLNTLKDLGSWVLENVLIPLADWAANSVLPAFLNVLGGAFLALNDALLFLQPVAQWLWDNVLAPIASWTGGVIVDVINAIGDWIQEHHETLGKVVATIAAGLAAVEALSIALKVIEVIKAIPAILSAIISPAALVIAAIVGLVALFVELYDSCDGFREGVDQVWQGIKDIFFAGIEFVKALFEGDWAGMDAAWAKIVTAGEDLWEGLWSGLQAGWTWIKEKLTGLWEKVTKAFCDFFGIHSPSTVFADFGKYMMEGLVKGIKGALSKVTDACREIWTEIKKVFASVGTWFQDTFRNAWQKVKDVFSSGGKIFDGIKDGIASTFKTIVNGLITGINKVIATPFNSINSMLNTIRGITILGVSPFKNLWSYNPLSIPQIPKLALGGIVNRPGRGVPAIIGEAGAEAVLPLENNTEWMDILADKINGGNVTIPIYMDGKKIYTYMVDIGKRKAFAANGV